MLLISHRGNLKGPIPAKENHPSQILYCFEQNYDVEIDVWFKDGNFYLGHDTPLYNTDIQFLSNTKLWCHAKNNDAFINLQKHNIHCFWHQTDTFTLTSKNYIWCYPGNLLENGIIVLPETSSLTLLDIVKSGAAGICSDYISEYKH